MLRVQLLSHLRPVSVRFFNLAQELDLSFRGQEAGLYGIRCEFAEMFVREGELCLRQPVFIFQIAREHCRIVGVNGGHQPSVEVAANRVVGKAGAAPGVEIRRDADFDGNLTLGEHFHQLGVVDGCEPMTNAFGSDIEGAPDPLWAYGFTSMRGEAQASISGFGVELTEGLSAGVTFVAANTDANDRGILTPQLGGFAEDARRLLDSEL